LLIYIGTHTVADIQKENTFTDIEKDTHLLIYRRTHPVENAYIKAGEQSVPNALVQYIY